MARKKSNEKQGKRWTTCRECGCQVPPDEEKDRFGRCAECSWGMGTQADGPSLTYEFSSSAERFLYYFELFERRMVFTLGEEAR